MISASGSERIVGLPGRIAERPVIGWLSILFNGSSGASSLACSTSSEKIGAHILVECVYTGSSTLRWLRTRPGRELSSRPHPPFDARRASPISICPCRSAPHSTSRRRKISTPVMPSPVPLSPPRDPALRTTNRWRAGSRSLERSRTGSKSASSGAHEAPSAGSISSISSDKESARSSNSFRRPLFPEEIGQRLRPPLCPLLLLPHSFAI